MESENYQLDENARVLSELNGFAITDMSLIGTLSERVFGKLTDAIAVRNYSELYYENGETKIMENSAYRADDDMYVSGEIFEKFGIFEKGLVSVKTICSNNNLYYRIYEDICVIGRKSDMKKDEIQYLSDILNKY